MSSSKISIFSSVFWEQDRLNHFSPLPLLFSLSDPVFNYIFSLDLQGSQKSAEIKHPREP
ncbi:MAG: hypothetical protein EWV48_07050 [Microcystis aeruginosa Ma_QC_C_20070823_S13]|nr:MAG: hypothetical protein EWV48_07050 [Microcystis aeruginosa Ma_QC_C_20070823_S13]